MTCFPLSVSFSIVIVFLVCLACQSEPQSDELNTVEILIKHTSNGTSVHIGTLDEENDNPCPPRTYPILSLAWDDHNIANECIKLEQGNVRDLKEEEFKYLWCHPQNHSCCDCRRGRKCAMGFDVDITKEDCNINEYYVRHNTSIGTNVALGTLQFCYGCVMPCEDGFYLSNGNAWKKAVFTNNNAIEMKRNWNSNYGCPDSLNIIRFPPYFGTEKYDSIGTQKCLNCVNYCNAIGEGWVKKGHEGNNPTDIHTHMLIRLYNHCVKWHHICALPSGILGEPCGDDLSLLQCRINSQKGFSRSVFYDDHFDAFCYIERPIECPNGYIEDDVQQSCPEMSSNYKAMKKVINGKSGNLNCFKCIEMCPNESIPLYDDSIITMQCNEGIVLTFHNHETNVNCQVCKNNTIKNVQNFCVDQKKKKSLKNYFYEGYFGAKEVNQYLQKNGFSNDCSGDFEILKCDSYKINDDIKNKYDLYTWDIKDESLIKCCTCIKGCKDNWVQIINGNEMKFKDIKKNEKITCKYQLQSNNDIVDIQCCQKEEICNKNEIFENNWCEQKEKGKRMKKDECDEYGCCLCVINDSNIISCDFEDGKTIGNGNNMCYKKYNNLLTFKEAKKICHEWEGNIAIPIDEIERKFMLDQYQKHDKFLWIGVEYDVIESTYFVAGDTKQESLLEFVNITKYLDDVSNNKYPAHVLMENGKWKNVNPNILSSFICEREMYCPNGYFNMGNEMCFKFYMQNENSYNFNDAKMKCRSEGSNIAKVTKEIESILYALYKQENLYANYWIESTHNECSYVSKYSNIALQKCDVKISGVICEVEISI